jgi:hypothetical protein
MSGCTVSVTVHTVIKINESVSEVKDGGRDKRWEERRKDRGDMSEKYGENIETKDGVEGSEIYGSETWRKIVRKIARKIAW